MAGRSPTMLSRRGLLTGAAAIGGTAALSGGLSACGTAAVANPDTLQFWTLLSGGDGGTMADMLAKVTGSGAAYDVKTTTLVWGEPYYTKLAMAATGGRPPDVAIMHASRVPGYAPGGLLDTWDIDRLAELGVSEDTFPEEIWKKGMMGEKLFAVALDAHPTVMMFNTDICDKAGVLESDGKLRATTSPDEFVDLLEQLGGQTKGGHPLSYGYLGDGAQMFRLFYTFYTQHGATMKFPEGGEAEIDDDIAIESLELMQRLLDGKLTAQRSDYASAIAEFATERSAMLFTGVWELRTMVSTGMSFDMAAIPTLYGTPSTFADSHAFVLPHQNEPDERRRDLTYQFVADLLKGSYDWATAGHIPAYLPVTESADYAKLTPQSHYAEVAQQVSYEPEAWFTGSASNFQSEFGAAIQPALMTGKDAAAAVDAFRARVNRLLKTTNPVDPDGTWKP
ncbi:extracellular solute-binding protein [Nocardioides sp.]|uniref:extracellular solute-binding protein n=1 Tax=Nocardioides sp. TaxID=35761 RepID=UPI0019AD07E1|nr:extracellular solute-binding protein [Nocardioides sp.]MBC7276384.1 extracellular solute-binding protein [Nocardioides sp.]